MPPLSNGMDYARRMKSTGARLQLQITCVRTVARHQSESLPSIVAEEDISGLYERLNATTLYCRERSRFVELNREGMKSALDGAVLRISASAVS